MSLRDKFAGAKLSANKDVQKQAAVNNVNYSNADGRAEFFKIEEGKNVFRILPPHPEDTIGAAYLPKRVAMLQCEVEIFKDGKPTGTTEVKSKNVFIATQHGGLPKDPIELYIDYVRRYANDAIQDKDEKSKFLAPITGWRDKKGDWHWGISPKTSFIAYAIQSGKIGRVELYDAWVKSMEKLAATEDVNDVMAVDPFSDPNEGFPLIITKEKGRDKAGKETGKWEHTISKDEPSRTLRESWNEFFERTAVTDEQLLEFLKQKPLSELYGLVYTKRDWDLAMDGLRRFDAEYKYKIFENEEFLEQLAELLPLVPAAKQSENNSPAPENDSVQRAFQKEAEMQQSMPISTATMKEEIRRFLVNSGQAEYIEQIPFSKVEVQKWYALLEEGEDLPLIKKSADKVNQQGNTAIDTANALDTENEANLQAQLQRMRDRNKQH